MVAEAPLGQERFFLVDVNDSETESGEKWIRIGLQSGGNLERSTNTTDTTNKDNFGFTSEKGVSKGWSTSVDGQENPHNVGLLHLASKWESTTDIDVRIHVMLIDELGREYVGWATLASFTLDFPVNESVTYSLSLNGRGVLVRRN